MHKYLLGIRQLSEFYVFQQDRAPAHTYAKHLTVDEGDSRLHSAMFLPPNSPALNAVDYIVWSVMQEVYKGRINYVD